jgi:RNA polymerase sigma-70 factor (ECF subfamily)
VDQDDRARFEVLYRETVRQVLVYALTRTNRENAHDVVSSTYLVAWRRFGEVPVDGLPWLIGVARRVLADQRRSEARRAALDQRVAADATRSQGSNDVVMESLALRGSIRDALSHLRSEDREIVTLVAWHGFNTEQLAVALGCSKALASLRLHRARRRFAEHFEVQPEHLPKSNRPVIRPAKEVR